jgi:Secretion system C-terminal sorting domain
MKSLKITTLVIGIIISISSGLACVNSSKCDILKAEWDSKTRTFKINTNNIQNIVRLDGFYVDWMDEKTIYEILPLLKPYNQGDLFISVYLPEELGDPLQGGKNGNGALSVSTNSAPCGGCMKTFSFYNITNNAYIKSACLDTYKSNVPTCPSGVFVDKISGEQADSVRIYGTIEANCCGTHLASISKKSDSILVITKDTGELCKCMCNYCFEIKVPISYGNKILKFNNTIYKINSSSAIVSIEENERTIISPNPATPSETITIKGEYASDAKVSITSVGGTIVGSVTPSVGTDAMTMSLSGLNLQAGIYFLRIESGEKVFSGKLCVK